MLPPLAAVGITRHHVPVKNYAKIRNAFHRDIRVKPRAAKVGAYILTHADGFTQSQAQLAANTGLSVMTVRAALGDLTGLGYMAMKTVREAGRIVGTAYAMADTPFTREELAALTAEDVASQPCTKSVPTKSVPPKKTRSRRDSSPVEEDQPSGGAGHAAPPTSPATVAEEPPTAEEDDMPKTDPAQAPLFEVPSPEPPAAEARKTAGAQAVIAAYVEAWREINSGAEPLRATKGRIARDAKAMLAKSEATETELVQAARAMASGPWSNIAQQIIIQRRARGRGAPLGHSVPLPQEHPSWSQGAAEEAARRAEAPLTEEEQAYLREYVQAGVA